MDWGMLLLSKWLSEGLKLKNMIAVSLTILYFRSKMGYNGTLLLIKDIFFLHRLNFAGSSIWNWYYKYYTLKNTVLYMFYRLFLCKQIIWNVENIFNVYLKCRWVVSILWTFERFLWRVTFFPSANFLQVFPKLINYICSIWI